MIFHVNSEFREETALRYVMGSEWSIDKETIQGWVKFILFHLNYWCDAARLAVTFKNSLLQCSITLNFTVSFHLVETI